MVDIQYIKDFNEGRYSPIKDGAIIPADVSDYLMELSPNVIRSLVNLEGKKASEINLHVQSHCLICQKNIISRSGHISEITRLPRLRHDCRFEHSYICSDCLRKRSKAKHWIGYYQTLPKQDEDDAPTGQMVLPDPREYPPAEFFIKTFLDSSKPLLTHNENPEQLATRVEAWAMAAEADAPGIIARQIKRLDYHDFLRTPYWRLVANRAKFRAGYRCSLCHSQTRLRAHHRSYDHLGEELFYPEEITCLCDDCHNKYHVEKRKQNDYPR